MINFNEEIKDQARVIEEQKQIASEFAKLAIIFLFVSIYLICSRVSGSLLINWSSHSKGSSFASFSSISAGLI